jgi:hypothetical protein
MLPPCRLRRPLARAATLAEQTGKESRLAFGRNDCPDALVSCALENRPSLLLIHRARVQADNPSRQNGASL